jgi:SEC-C motif
MPQLPAFCDCGNIFPSAYAISGGVGNIRNVRCQCPKCGKQAHVPDGLYRTVGETLELLSAPERSIKELARLAEILRSAQKTKASPEVLDKKIASELPALAALTKLLPKTTSDRIALINTILVAITLLKDCAPQRPTVEQVIEQTYVSATTVIQAPAVPSQPKKKKTKVGRNELCPCGSGKKSKHCCGGSG